MYVDIYDQMDEAGKAMKSDANEVILAKMWIIVAAKEAMLGRPASSKINANKL